MLYNFFVYKKYRKSFLARLGFKFPIISKSEGPRIWIHAVSLGETKAVIRLAKELKQLVKNCQLIISSVTETGFAESQRSLPFVDYHVYLPFDFHWIVDTILSKTSPDLVILCESDLWYNFLYKAKKLGSSIVLVNGKISQRSMNHFRKVPFFAKSLFGLFDLICLQNQLYESRFQQIKAPFHRMTVTGNLKLDEEYPQLSKEDLQTWKTQLSISQAHVVLTIGSTHYPEEELFLKRLKEIWVDRPFLKVLLVPRHPERFKEVSQLLEKEKISFIKFSEIQQQTGKEKLILVDAMGVLRMCYQLSDIALVAGSFTPKVGGHNILEPCWYGKPVLFGPYMHTQIELVKLMQQHQAGLQVAENELQKILEKWIDNPEERINVGQKGLTLVRELRGATQKTLSHLSPILENIENKYNIRFSTL